MNANPVCKSVHPDAITNKMYDAPNFVSWEWEQAAFDISSRVYWRVAIPHTIMYDTDAMMPQEIATSRDCSLVNIIKSVVHIKQPTIPIILNACIV